MNKKLHSVLDDGTEIFEYPDGALRTTKGYWYKRPPNATPFDKERSALANVRKSAIKQHRIETLQGEVRRSLKKSLRSQTAEQAGAKLVSGIIEIAKDKQERAADRLASTKYVLQQAGLAAKEQTGSPSITLQMTPEAIDRMYALSMGIPDQSGMPELPANDWEDSAEDGVFVGVDWDKDRPIEAEADSQ